MYGSVVSYDAGTGVMVFNPHRVVGSGTRSSWTINLDGVVGVQGPTGETGNTGPTGPTGMTGPTGEPIYTAIIFDGGFSTSTYVDGPAFDCGTSV
jgi:hypothetical protein